MGIREDAKGLIIEGANKFKIPEELKQKIEEERRSFQTEFSKEKIAKLDKEHYFQGRGIKLGNFTYELEWNSRNIGGIGGGSVFKFGYENDFEKIKELLIEILSGNDSRDQFYNLDGHLTEFSRKIVEKTDHLKGIGRVFIGKILSIYFPNTFLMIFGHQDYFLDRIYDDYKPESSGVELYLNNNLLLLNLKNKYASNLSNDEFVELLYDLFKKESIIEQNQQSDEELKIEALEVQHQNLIHRNFKKLFPGLKYYDEERQNESNGHFDTQEVGIMDFLAINQDSDVIVIELKRKSTDETLGQILRYMGWVKKNLCDKKQKVSGVILAETKDNRLEYALMITPDVKFKKMKITIEIEH